MELQHYLRIVRRSWPLVLGLPALVALLTLALAFILPTPYEITAAVLVTQRPIAAGAPPTILPDQNNWNSWAASEYIVDDLLQIVETRRFATDIGAWLQAEHGITLTPKRISESLDAGRRHRMIFVTVSADRADYARLIAQGAITMLEQKGLEYWNRADTASLAVAQAELPERAEPARGLLSISLDLVLRTALALLLAIGLAFLRHYLDQSLYRRGEVEALGLEVVGMIPMESARP